MDREIFPKGWKVYLPLIAVFAVLLFLLPRDGKFRYHYQKGRPWMYETLISPIDFPILKSEQELLKEKEERSSSVIPFFKYDETVKSRVIGGISSHDMPEDTAGTMADYIISLFGQIYDSGLVSAFSDEESRNGVIIVQRDRRALEVPVEDIYDINSADLYVRENMRSHFGEAAADSLYAALSLSAYYVPNLKFDQATTDMIHKEASSYISPTKGIIYTGQLIVSQGEIVTSEIEQLLDSFKAEYLVSMGISGSTVWVIVGNVLLLMAALVILFSTILFVDRSIFSDMNKYLFILTVFTISSVATELLSDESGNYLMLVPYPLFALYMMAFFKKSTVFPLYTALLIPLLIIAQNGIEIFFINIVAGVVAVISFSRFNRGWLQFVNALFIFIALIVSSAIFMLIRSGDIVKLADYKDMFYLGMASLFCVAGYPLVFLFEKVFMLVSNSRLLDLADINNPLLRLLADKAPGTFQHVLQVMNLSDACARAIGANVNLARAGALYHDVGKSANPQCFIENAAPGVNYHSGLTPEESARDIIKHVDDGVALAKKYKIPQVVSDFILSHHGTSRTEYFYNVYVNAGGDPANASMFEYHGFKPRTKEQVIVMLSDTLEAASRSLKDYSEKSISELVDRIVEMKIDDGQLTDADISLKELSVVRGVLKEYLLQINHARIAYPKRKQ